MTVAELESRMSMAELERWALYEAEEPFLCMRVEFIGGLISSVFANIHKPRHVPSLTPLDFMPFTSRQMDQINLEKRSADLPSPVDEEEKILQTAVLMLGGRVVH